VTKAALTFLLTVAVPVAALAQNGAQDGARTPVPAGQQAGFDRIRESDLRADLGLVASDALQGRMSLQPGDDATVQWVAAEFAKAGLAPAARDDKGAPSFLQSVPLVEYRPNAAANFLALSSGGTTQRWQAPQIMGGYRDDVDLTAPLAFAGYGITAPGWAMTIIAGSMPRARSWWCSSMSRRKTIPPRALAAPATPAMPPTASRR
jgi:hypothetical protein